MLRLLLLVAAVSAEYYGIKLGSLRNTTHGLSGDVYLANSSAIQIVNFNLKATKESTFGFLFSMMDQEMAPPKIFRVVTSPGGEYMTPLKGTLSKGHSNERIVVTIPHDYRKWLLFGVAEMDQQTFVSAVRLDREAPKPFCCLKDKEQPSEGLVTKEYGVKSKPIMVLDHKTLFIPGFHFRGTAPPDGWMFAGRGEVGVDTGKKAYVLGRDSRSKHCAIHEDYTNREVMVRLADGQTVYDIDYFAVFCYQYSVDFGSVRVALDPVANPVPVNLPPVRRKAPKAVVSIEC